MSKEIRLKKGLNINLVGDADKVYASVKTNDRNNYVVKPTDFHAVTPKLNVKIGDKVKAGTSLFFDKDNNKINNDINKLMKKLLKKFSLTEVVEIVHKLTNISKKEIYSAALLIKDD